MLMSVNPTENIINFSKEDYFAYGYHKNTTKIIHAWIKKHLQMVQQNQDAYSPLINEYYRSLLIKNEIDKNIWKLYKRVQRNQEQLDYLTEQSIAHANITLINSGHVDIAEQEQTSENVTERVGVINAQRAYFSVIRNMYTFMLKYSMRLDIVNQLNTFNSLLATYLFGLRLSMNAFIALNMETNNMSLSDRAYGYFKAHQQQIYNDLLWFGLLLASTLNYYCTAENVQKFYNTDYHGLIFSGLFTVGLVLDTLNNYKAVLDLDKDWEQFKNKVGEDKIPQELELTYQSERKERWAEVKYTTALCLTNLSLAILGVCDYLHQINPSLISSQASAIFPYLEVLVTCLMFIYHLRHLTRKYWDEDYKKLSPEEQEKIYQEAMFNIAKEIAKIIAMAVIIFVLSSHIHVAGLPGMLILAAITIASILLINTVADYLKKEEPTFEGVLKAPLPEPNTASTH